MRAGRLFCASAFIFFPFSKIKLGSAGHLAMQINFGDRHFMKLSVWGSRVCLPHIGWADYSKVDWLKFILKVKILVWGTKYCPKQQNLE